MSTRVPFLEEFVRESNRIEGITRDPTPAELEATDRFICLPTTPTVADLENLVHVLQPGAHIRVIEGMDVRVGNHLPPKGGPIIQPLLEGVLFQIEDGKSPWRVHTLYETLHPFMDGNGRSGRALWAWMMIDRHGSQALKLGFLHMFYYQTLEEAR